MDLSSIALKSLVFGLALTSLSACKSIAPQARDVWGDELKTEGFKAIYPPREGDGLGAVVTYKDGSEILVSQGPRKRPRRLTPRECARLMGFPDVFIIPVSDTQAYKQFGNSVVLPVMREVARVMKPRIMELMDPEQGKQKSLLVA